MEQRPLGRVGWPVAAIGLGTEYLLDRPREVISAVLARAAAGVGYIDLLYNLPRFLAAFGPALRPFRHQFRLGVQLGLWRGQRPMRANVRDQALCEQYFAVPEATGCDYADVALLMMVDDLPTWNGWAQESLERLTHYRCQGRVGAIGLSTHFAEVGQKAVASGAIDVLMYPVNPASCAVPANRDLLDACARRGVAVVAMKPYAGGVMFGAHKQLVHWFLSGGEFVDAEVTRPATPAQCLSFALDQPAVATAVPGVRDLAELETALAYLAATPEVTSAYDGLLLAAAPLSRLPVRLLQPLLPCLASIDIGAVAAAARRRGGPAHRRPARRLCRPERQCRGLPGSVTIACPAALRGERAADVWKRPWRFSLSFAAVNPRPYVSRRRAQGPEPNLPGGTR
jgi:aryl-alcohol dehydrogenase-like predicted oxidoreductase